MGSNKEDATKQEYISFQRYGTTEQMAGLPCVMNREKLPLNFTFSHPERHPVPRGAGGQEKGLICEFSQNQNQRRR